MPNINIDDAYILNETGAQVDKVTGLFTKDEDTTSGEKAFAQLNIGTAGSNRNLLDNPWFRIDQRSVSGTITSGYIADRWTITYGSGGVQASRTADSITVKSTSGSSHGDIAQRMEKSLFDFLVGKTVTASVMRSNGSVISKSFTFQPAVNSIDVGTDLDGKVISVRVYQTSTYQDVQFWKWNTAGTFRAVKLELGSVSTLANDVPPDYAEELRKCQYYFKRFSPTAYTVLWSGIAVNATQGAFFVNGEMRSGVNPTIAISGTGYIEQGTSMKLITSGQGYYTRQGTRLILTTSATLTSNTECCVYTSANQNFVVDISAEP